MKVDRFVPVPHHRIKVNVMNPPNKQMDAHRLNYVHQNRKVVRQRQMKLKTEPFDRQAVHILEVPLWKEKVVHARPAVKAAAKHQKVDQVCVKINIFLEILLYFASGAKLVS